MYPQAVGETQSVHNPVHQVTALTLCGTTQTSAMHRDRALTSEVHSPVRQFVIVVPTRPVA